MGAAHVAQQSYPSTQVGGAFAESSYVSDGIINPHPRFGTLTQNIRSRRGCKVDIRVPLFRDTKTPEYDGVAPPACCEITGLPTGQSVWSYGKPHLVPDHLGNKFVMTGCSNDLDWLSRGRVREGAPATLRKYRVQVDDPAREIDGLYYRSMPGVIIADKDWPRCGSVVVGAEGEQSSERNEVGKHRLANCWLEQCCSPALFFRCPRQACPAHALPAHALALSPSLFTPPSHPLLPPFPQCLITLVGFACRTATTFPLPARMGRSGTCTRSPTRASTLRTMA